jgi:hypothetical protein
VGDPDDLPEVPDMRDLRMPIAGWTDIDRDRDRIVEIASGSPPGR